MGHMNAYLPLGRLEVFPVGIVRQHCPSAYARPVTCRQSDGLVSDQ